MPPAKCFDICYPLSCKSYSCICWLGGTEVLFSFSCKLYRSPPYLLLNIREEYGSLGKKDEPCTAFPEHFEICCTFQYSMLWQNMHSLINPFAALPLWLIGIYTGKNLFAFVFAKSFLSKLNACFTKEIVTERFQMNLYWCKWHVYTMLTSIILFLSFLW